MVRPEGLRLLRSTLRSWFLFSTFRIFPARLARSGVCCKAYQQLLSSKEGESFGQMEDAPLGGPAAWDDQLGIGMGQHEFTREVLVLVSIYQASILGTYF